MSLLKRPISWLKKENQKESIVFFPDKTIKKIYSYEKKRAPNNKKKKHNANTIKLCVLKCVHVCARMCSCVCVCVYVCVCVCV